MDIPGDSPTTPYLIPSIGLGITSGMALEPSGNIDVVKQGYGLVTELDCLNTINVGSAPVFGTGIVVPFNFEFDTPTTLAGFQAVTGGVLRAGTLSTGKQAAPQHRCHASRDLLPAFIASAKSIVNCLSSA
jgi:hypothetical protein